ncbi:type II secretion system secretin GspD [Thiohalorhabdus sp.]|uniref:type II secretion system secretin GspD n=1 Tax=Thiohalorhabdus sp. TaxID=3094134 RepID=UPI002FC38A05
MRRLILVAVVYLGLTHATSPLAAKVNFDFQDADLRAVIQAVAEFTGRNFLVDPRVEGKVTVIAPQGLNEDEAFRVFKSVLETNGYVLARGEGGVAKIIPQQEGKFNSQEKAAPGTSMVTRVIHMDHVSAQRLVPILRPLIPPYGHLVAYPDTESLIITERSAHIQEIVGIVERLDRSTDVGEVELISLVHASAEDLAEKLTKLYSQKGGQKAKGGGALTIMAYGRTNTLVVRADEATRNEIKNLAQDLDTPTGEGGQTHVIYLENAEAKSLVEILQNTVGGRKEGGGEQGGDRVTLKADPQTNALVVRAGKNDFQTIQNVVEKLDVRRLQVYVEALIAEVSAETAREFGIQWQAANGLQGNNQGVVGTSSFSVGDSIQGAAQNPLGLGAGLSVGYVDGTLTLPNGTNVANVLGLVRALESRSDANVLSTPNLLTMDNEEAEIVVGQNVPFVTGSFSQNNQGTNVQNPFQTIERKDVGLTLRLKPQITEGSAIKLDIYQEVSSVTQQGQAQDIVTNKRSLDTTVVAENQRMVVLGGLIEDEVNKSVQEVPLLGRIPLLGALFRYKSVDHQKTNLMIFLRPQIIRGPADLDQATREKYNYLEDLREVQGIEEGTGEKPPPLEKWDRIVPKGETAGQAPEEGEP